MIEIILISVYWICFYVSMDLILEKKRNNLNYRFRGNGKILEKYFLVNLYKDFFPSISRFNKKKIKSKNVIYLNEYLKELKKAFLIHTIPFLGLFIFIFNIKILVINFLFVLIFNIFFVIIILYNGIRLQKIVDKKEQK